MISQNAILKGKVSSKENNGEMPFVAVVLNEKQMIYTDSKGNYTFTKLPAGKHNLVFQILGYDKFEQEINIQTDSELVTLPVIQLLPSSIQIAEVIVNIPNTSYSSKFEGSNIVVSSKEIELTKPIGTEEVLKKVSGVNVSGDMGISNRLNVGIRGSYPRRAANILLMEDGTPIAPAPYLGPEAYYNPPSDRLDGIEILKGADILMYGSNTMYGAINYITKKPPVKPTLGLNITAGENGYHSEYLTYGGTWNKLGAELQVLNKSIDGFQDNSSSDIFNTSLKLYSELSKKSSFYVKLNYHQENSKASYSALTPFSYKKDPRQNPFDADDLLTKRYAVDLIHNYQISDNMILSSKVYASQFQRDWWRQENTVISASLATNYLKEDIISNRFTYLNGATFGPDDYIRVGKIANGKESALARNRIFKFGGVQETFKYNIEKNSFKMNLEVVAKIHAEGFNNMEIKNDSSRFARSGTIVKDQYFELYSYSGVIKDKFSYGRVYFTPYLRYETVEMRSFDKLAISKMPANNGDRNYGSLYTNYSSLIPGASVVFNFMKNEKNDLSLYTGIYKGYTAPTAEVGFLNVEDGKVSAVTANKPANRTPETSINYEIGLRGEIYKSLLGTQLTYFNNNIQNFYSAGRNEAFQTLGAVNISGIESTVLLNLHKLLNTEKHSLVLSFSGTYMQGKVLSGKLSDSDVLKAKHTSQTKEELISKINAEREGYHVYFAGLGGKDSLVNGSLSVSDFSKIKRLDIDFGDGKIANNSIPYLPPYILNVGFSYGFKGISIGANVNFVAKQFTDYLNFNNETAEGAIGSLDSFKTIDANLAYSFEGSKNKYLKGFTLFIAGKNITNEVYKASRLHRLSSGIMPGGFRQMNAGLKFRF
ncbi:MAG: TonB-dependent receptor [Sphingobacteriaceae bacterium]|nr:TonB-dependent receptor [Sphingobacteriaceae bacterium]